MMDEDTLKLALVEADNYIMERLPVRADYEHEFSRSFVRKLQKLIRKERFPLIYEIRRIVAAVLIFLTLSAGILMVTNEEVRAAVLNWILTVQRNDSGWDSYWYEGNSDLHRNVSDYTLEGLVPEGYTLIDRDDDETFASELYINENGTVMLSFWALSPDSDWDLGLFPDEHTIVIPIQSEEAEGELYISDLEGDSNAFVWRNQDDILFCIGGILTKEELLDLSEKIK